MIPPNDAHITLMNYDDPLEWAQSVTRELENILLKRSPNVAAPPAPLWWHHTGTRLRNPRHTAPRLV